MGRRSRLTEKKLDALRYIFEHCKKHQGMFPTHRDIVANTEYSSTSNIPPLLEDLEERGILKAHQRGVQVKYTVVGSVWLPPVDSPIKSP